jgi:hypothetical protein
MLLLRSVTSRKVPIWHLPVDSYCQVKRRTKNDKDTTTFFVT